MRSICKKLYEKRLFGRLLNSEIFLGIIFLETLRLLANKRIIKTNDREAIVGWRSNTTLMKQGKRWILMDRL